MKVSLWGLIDPSFKCAFDLNIAEDLSDLMGILSTHKYNLAYATEDFLTLFDGLRLVHGIPEPVHIHRNDSMTVTDIYIVGKRNLREIL